MERRVLTVLGVLCGASLATGIAIAGVSQESLPLGDGKVTTAGAKRGYVYVCQRSNGNAPGAFRQGPWIKGQTFDYTRKAVVDGSVKWPAASVSIKASGSKLKIASNGLPVDDTTGNFPIASSDDAYQYDRNPNSIRTTSFSVSLPASPKKGVAAGCVSGGPIGLAINGVPIFNALDAGDRDAVANEAQDSCSGHPQREGSYHYHSISACLPRSGVVGYAFDGFPILGKIERGKAVTNANLDACHGHTHAIKLRGRKVKRYHYHGTSEYPYTIGCFRGRDHLR